MNERVRKRAIAATAVVGALAVAGGAGAHFVARGSGHGAANVGTALPVTIDAGAAPATDLFPGGDGDVTLRISNPNSFAVHIGSLALDPSQGDAGFAASPPGCNLAAPALLFTPQRNGSAGWDVPANRTLALDLAASIHMTVAASNACQGATFTVYLDAGR